MTTSADAVGTFPLRSPVIVAADVVSDVLEAILVLIAGLKSHHITCGWNPGHQRDLINLITQGGTSEKKPERAKSKVRKSMTLVCSSQPFRHQYRLKDQGVLLGERHNCTAHPPPHNLTVVGKCARCLPLHPRTSRRRGTQLRSFAWNTEQISWTLRRCSTLQRDVCVCNFAGKGRDE